MKTGPALARRTRELARYRWRRAVAAAVFTLGVLSAAAGVVERLVFPGGTKVVQQAPAATLRFLTRGDAQGGARLLVGAAGHLAARRYAPCGQAMGAAPTGHITRGFTGQEFDASTGLYNFNARQYQPEMGHFISADTIALNPASPQSRNRFAYCGGDPANFTDPSGHHRELGEGNPGRVIRGPPVDRIGGMLQVASATPLPVSDVVDVALPVYMVMRNGLNKRMGLREPYSRTEIGLALTGALAVGALEAAGNARAGERGAAMIRQSEEAAASGRRVLVHAGYGMDVQQIDMVRAFASENGWAYVGVDPSLRAYVRMRLHHGWNRKGPVDLRWMTMEAFDEAAGPEADLIHFILFPDPKWAAVMQPQASASRVFMVVTDHHQTFQKGLFNWNQAEVVSREIPGLPYAMERSASFTFEERGVRHAMNIRSIYVTAFTKWALLGE